MFVPVSMFNPNKKPTRKPVTNMLPKIFFVVFFLGTEGNPEKVTNIKNK